MTGSHASAGVAAALLIIGLWLGSTCVLLFNEIATFWVVPGLLWMTFLSTGLFIVAHDAMHATVAPASPPLNAILGSVAVGLYALFSYRKLRAKHAEHHSHPARPGKDPDYHDGTHTGFWRWYLHFVFGYVGFFQIVGMAIIFNVLSHVVAVPEFNLLAFWVLPALLSTLQLFYFGTYLPHRGEHADGDEHRTRSNEYPVWLSFVTCYHFGYHREHHERPGVPWWGLPATRK